MTPSNTSWFRTSPSESSSSRPSLQARSTCFTLFGGVQFGGWGSGWKESWQRRCKWAYENGRCCLGQSPWHQLIRYAKAFSFIVPCLRHLGAIVVMFFWTCSEIGLRGKTPDGCWKPASKEAARSSRIKTTTEKGSTSAILFLAIKRISPGFLGCWPGSSWIVHHPVERPSTSHLRQIRMEPTPPCFGGEWLRSETKNPI